MRMASGFVLAAAGIIFTGMAILSGWMSGRIDRAITQDNAQTAALFMESIVEPLVQDLATNDGVLSDVAVRAIAGVIDQPSSIGHGVNSIRIWRRDGSIAYPNQPKAAQLPPTELVQAFEGRVVFSRNVWGAKEGTSSSSFLSIFAPIHLQGTSTIIGVAEYVEPSLFFDKAVAKGNRETWTMIIGFSITTLLLLVAVFFSGGRLLARHNQLLEERYWDQVRLNIINDELKNELQRARVECIDINERFLRRVGADLHDGPAQLLALAMLRLDDIAGSAAQSESAMEALSTVRHATVEAMREIRNISSDLVVPEQKWKSVEDAIKAAVSSHQKATGDRVDCRIECLPKELSKSSMICLYRALQESLTNAHRHAGGKGIVVHAHCNGKSFDVEVRDQGPGFDVAKQSSSSNRLGLAGLRHRIESVGGRLDIKSELGAGTRLCIILPNTASGCHVV